MSDAQLLKTNIEFKKQVFYHIELFILLYINLSL